MRIVEHSALEIIQDIEQFSILVCDHSDYFTVTLRFSQQDFHIVEARNKMFLKKYYSVSKIQEKFYLPNCRYLMISRSRPLLDVLAMGAN